MDTVPPIPVAATARVLLVLRDAKEAHQIASVLERQDIEAVHVSDDAAGYNLLDTEQVDALICEIGSPRIDGLQLLRVARMRNPEVCTILIATQSSIDRATRAMGDGVHDFQTRPLNLEKIEAVIRRGLTTQRLIGEMHELARQLDRKLSFGNLIGNSAPIVRVYNRILQISANDAPVLILGESGTGRDLVASVIHHNSARRNGPLVRFDCGGLGVGFLDRELFGEAGTKEQSSRPGRCELAEEGTLILDRIEELPIDVQGRIVRLLRGREFERVDGGRILRADVRIVAIGPLDLRQQADTGRFRADLFEHLQDVTIEMPALRHRKRDIALLANHFLTEAREETGRTISGFRPEVMDRLVRYSWPGNVRELKNVIRGMIQTATGGGPLDLESLPEEIREGEVSAGVEIRVPLGMSLSEVERRVIETTLARLNGDRRQAARVLGIGLRTLQRRLAEYALKRPRS
jgi:DNA-binding NtrC family response regulator